MPDKDTIERAKLDKRQGKAPSTQAGEFVREEIEHVREGKHGVRSTKQAIAIGLSKARRAGVDLPPPAKGTVSERTARSARSAYRAGRKGEHHTSRTRARAATAALKHEPKTGASHAALARQARSAAAKHTRSERSAAARTAARTKGPVARSAAARKAAHTRAARRG